MKMNITVKNAKYGFEKNLVVKSVEFAKEHLAILRPLRKLNITVTLKKMQDDHGWVMQGGGKRDYEIQIANNYETIYDFVSTIMHEMAHVAQYIETGYTDEEGEKDAEFREERLTNQMWQENLI